MTIQVYPYNQKEEKALLDFLKSRHYSYKSADEDEMTDTEFLDQYNKDLDESEAEIDAGDSFTQDEVKQILADRRKRISGN
jgi:hypothetical protein